MKERANLRLRPTDPSVLDVLQIQNDVCSHLEAGVMGAPGVYPDWVYEARLGMKHAREGPAWLGELLKALEWQGGTIHQALNAVHRLVQSEKERERKNAQS